MYILGVKQFFSNKIIFSKMYVLSSSDLAVASFQPWNDADKCRHCLLLKSGSGLGRVVNLSVNLSVCQ